MELILLSGLSGSGKSVALNLLEDIGYFCVDNLPSALLTTLIDELNDQKYSKVAIAIDIRSGEKISQLPEHLDTLKNAGHQCHFIFLEAHENTLFKRFSETRRRHPLAKRLIEQGEIQTESALTLTECIQEERLHMQPLAELGHRIDTSNLKANALRAWMRQLLSHLSQQAQQTAQHSLLLLFESFGFKHGIPLDADLVFDVRCLPNPYYEETLRKMTGNDKAIVQFLESFPAAIRMRNDIENFIDTWLPDYLADSRSYLTIAIGCTGGQHRSVYFANWLSESFKKKTFSGVNILLRHRELGSIIEQSNT